MIGSIPPRDDQGATSSVRVAAKIALVWTIMGALATAGVMPYVLDLIPGVLDKIKVPVVVLVFAQIVQSGALLFALSLVGLSCSSVTTLDSPLVRGWLQGSRPTADWRPRLVAASMLGALTGGLLLILADASAGALPPPRMALPRIALWKRLLASLYGGVTEECLVHLFLMSMAAWLLLKMVPTATSSARNRFIWMAMLLSALLFALGHLPAVATIWPLSGPVVARTVVLNGLGGMVFGWLFWRWGFEAAVLAHLCADLVLHGLGG